MLGGLAACTAPVRSDAPEGWATRSAIAVGVVGPVAIAHPVTPAVVAEQAGWPLLIGSSAGPAARAVGAFAAVVLCTLGASFVFLPTGGVIG